MRGLLVSSLSLSQPRLPNLFVSFCRKWNFRSKIKTTIHNCAVNVGDPHRPIFAFAGFPAHPPTATSSPHGHLPHQPPVQENLHYYNDTLHSGLSLKLTPQTSAWLLQGQQWGQQHCSSCACRQPGPPLPCSSLDGSWIRLHFQSTVFLLWAPMSTER